MTVTECDYQWEHDHRDYVVTVLLNVATDFRAYRPEQQESLVYDPAMVLSVRADSPVEAAEEAYRIGNRIGADRDGKQWPSWVRSVSVGDVLLVRGWHGRSTDLTVAGVGFAEVDLDHSNDSRLWNRAGGRLRMLRAGAASEDAPAEPECSCSTCRTERGRP